MIKFDQDLIETYKELVIWSLDYIKPGVQDVHSLSLFCYMSELRSFYFNASFRFGDKWHGANEVQSLFALKADVMSFYKEGTRLVQKLGDLFLEEKHDIPTYIRLDFDVATNNFNSDIVYELENRLVDLAPSEIYEDLFGNVK